MAVMVVVKELLASKTLSKVHLLEGRAALVFTFPSLSPFFAFFLFPSPHFIGHTGRVISSCVDDTTMAPADSPRVVVSDGAERERKEEREKMTTTTTTTVMMMMMMRIGAITAAPRGRPYKLLAALVVVVACTVVHLGLNRCRCSNGGSQWKRASGQYFNGVRLPNWSWPLCHRANWYICHYQRERLCLCHCCYGPLLPELADEWQPFSYAHSV